jgi:23S rRNA (cytosine1962-C5)-methyltransferase
VHTVRVTRKGAQRIASGHPWIFATDVADRGNASGGDAVFAVDENGKPLGTFHYSSSSQITLRQLSGKQQSIDRDFFRQRIESALQYRRAVVRDSDACRVVFGEADLLPALIVDKYGDALAIQTLSQGMERAQSEIVAVLQELLTPSFIVARNDAAVRRREELPLEVKVVAGGDAVPVEIRMNGLTWLVDLLAGQKTGIYLDQRENYLAAGRYARGRGLDCFTSTGGFALHLARACSTVEAADSSEQALRTAAANAERNGIANVNWREADVFDVLAAHARAGRRFDTVVLDPPAFTKSRGTVEGALRGYREINYRALRLLDPGGVLVTCSCSHHVSEADLLATVAQASVDAKRPLRVLERRFQAADHPVLLTVPETLYLKCLIFQAL